MKPRGRGSTRLFLIPVLAAVLLLPQAAAGNGGSDKVELTGFLAGLTGGRLDLPLPANSTETAQIEVPASLGSARISFSITLTSQTEVDLLGASAVSDGDFVEVELILQNGVLTVREIEEPEVGEFSGTFDLSGGTLTLPVVGADQTVTFLLFGDPTLPVQLTITSATDTDLTSLNDGDQVKVELIVVGGKLIAAEIEN